MTALRLRREQAEPERQARVADWLGAGQKGPRPVAEADELNAWIAERSAEVAAYDIERERFFAERVAFVSKRRKRCFVTRRLSGKVGSRVASLWLTS